MKGGGEEEYGWWFSDPGGAFDAQKVSTKYRVPSQYRHPHKVREEMINSVKKVKTSFNLLAVHGPFTQFYLKGYGSRTEWFSDQSEQCQM